MKKSLWKKQIPTLIGVGILVLALVVGVFVFTVGGGAGVFAPRATAETTPKKIKITNVTDTSFTVSFLTEQATAGFVTYGTTATDLGSRSGDDRDQLTGSVGSFNTHHVTVRGLSPNKSYFFLIGTGSKSTFDNNGQPFTIKTAQRNGAPGAAKTAYGNVVKADGNPAEGAIVYATIEGVGELSSLVKNSGSWAIPLSNARTADGSGYAQITDDQTMSLFAQGNQVNQTSNVAVTVEDSQPVPNITLGQDTLETAAAGTTTTTTDTTTTTTQETTTQTDTTTGVGGASDVDNLIDQELGDELFDNLESSIDGTSSTSSATFGSARQLAQANTSTAEPFGSSNPFPIGGTATGSTTTSTASATTTATASSRVTLPATTSALPVSGSVGTTMTLLIGGLFFLIAGGWSFWISNSMQETYATANNGHSKSNQTDLNIKTKIDESIAKDSQQSKTLAETNAAVEYQLPEDVPLI